MRTLFGSPSFAFALLSALLGVGCQVGDGDPTPVRSDGGTETCHRPQSFEHMQRAAGELARGENLGRNRGEQEIGREYRGVLQGADRALGIEQDEVVVRVEPREQVSQPHAPVRRVQDPVLQHPVGVVRDDQTETVIRRPTYDVLGGGFGNERR